MEQLQNKVKIDQILKQHGNIVLQNLANNCVDVHDGAYYLCGLTHDTLRMLFSILNNHTDKQSAKAIFKVALDDVLLDFGCSVAIHEFN